MSRARCGRGRCGSFGGGDIRCWVSFSEGMDEGAQVGKQTDGYCAWDKRQIEPFACSSNIRQLSLT